MLATPAAAFDAGDSWKADLDELNENIKIPTIVYAEVEASIAGG